MTVSAAKQIFVRIFNRMNREGTLFPAFIGEFDGVDAVPRGAYPPVYSWTDTSRGGAPVLSFNVPLLEKMCLEESEAAELTIDGEDVGDAISLLKDVSARAFEKVLLGQE